MFACTTKQVREEINDAIEAVADVGQVIEANIGDRSSFVINRLFSLRIDGEDEVRASIISRYAAFRLAVKKGPELINHLINVVGERGSNPS